VRLASRRSAVGGLRYIGGAAAFGFAAVWIMATLAAALVCLAAGVVGYCAGMAVERIRAERARPSSSPGIPIARDDLPLWADALNSDLGHVYDPAAATSALSREAKYGWPLPADSATSRQTLQ
jgi:hypothetical protein